LRSIARLCIQTPHAQWLEEDIAGDIFGYDCVRIGQRQAVSSALDLSSDGFSVLPRGKPSTSHHPRSSKVRFRSSAYWVTWLSLGKRPVRGTTCLGKGWRMVTCVNGPSSTLTVQIGCEESGERHGRSVPTRTIRTSDRPGAAAAALSHRAPSKCRDDSVWRSKSRTSSVNPWDQLLRHSRTASRASEQIPNRSRTEGTCPPDR